MWVTLVFVKFYFWVDGLGDFGGDFGGDFDDAGMWWFCCL